MKRSQFKITMFISLFTLVALFFVLTRPFHEVGAAERVKPLAPTPLAHVIYEQTLHQKSNTYSVTGEPTISTQFINNVLCQASSPACGTGAALYQSGVRYGIDPVYALAFFQHESTFGRYGVASVNKGLGNIRCSQGYTCLSSFRAYATWQEGYEDWYHLIRTLYVDAWGLTTVDTIVPRYAPSTENDTVGYIVAIKHAVDLWRHQQ